MSFSWVACNITWSLGWITPSRIILVSLYHLARKHETFHLARILGLSTTSLLRSGWWTGLLSALTCRKQQDFQEDRARNNPQTHEMSNNDGRLHNVLLEYHAMCQFYWYKPLDLSLFGSVALPALELLIRGSSGNTEFSSVTPPYTWSHRWAKAPGVFHAFSGSRSQSRIRCRLDSC